MRQGRFGAVLTTALLVLAGDVLAHDIPNDVTVRAFLKPDGQRLRLIVRAPLQAMRDIDYPRRGREFVDLSRAEPALREAAVTWIARDISVYEGAARLPAPQVVAVRASLPSDESFRSYDRAIAHLTAPQQTEETEFVWNQGWLDVWLEYTIQSDRAELSIDPRWGRLGVRTVTALRFLPPGGAIRAFELEGDPGLVRLDPRWHQAATRFIELGFDHILDGIDHLLFLFCLVIPFRRLRPLVLIVTSFTVAHSVTLAAAAYNLGPGALWFPPLIETLIAASILYMALENIVSSARDERLRPAPGERVCERRSASERGWGPASVKRRWIITFAFGLVHGFGFSFALQQTLQFAGSHLLTSLLSFNLGVELGQLLVLVLLVPALDLLFRFIVAERLGTIILSALVAHTAWHWMAERAEGLRQYSWQWPSMTPDLLLAVIRWLMLVVFVAGAAWLLFGLLRHAGRDSRWQRSR